MSVNIGSLVGTLKVIDEASGVIGKVQAGIGGLTNIMGKMGSVAGDVGQVIGSAFSGFATGGVAGAALGAGVSIMGEVVTGLQSCVKEATASEAVWASLGAAVERAGGSWQTLKKGTEDALLSMSKVTTYSDEQLAQALEKLMTFGLSYDDAMKALGQTIDFASAKHMDLESAATLVGKAMDGNTAILKRYGVDVTTSKEAAAALKEVLTPLGNAFTAMGGDVADFASNLVESVGVTAEFAQALGEAKDPAKFLVEQFQQGNIDLPQFMQILTDLGVPLDATKMKAGGAEEVLGALNKQFGGAAQEQAKTYAGVQERLKNATGEVAEKIGTIFLPALASLTESMIPVVDAFGKGVDAAQAWFNEMAKTPEVKGFLDSLAPAWESFMGYLNSIWTVIQDAFGPALQELWQAFKDIWDALQPAIDAFKEIFGAMSSGGESIDPLKLLIQYLAAEIRGIAAVIKFVAPYIKQFAEAFKAAADFISPILGQMSKDIGAFIDWLKTAFQGFYTWLVGGSLWMDMWNQLLAIASQMIGILLGDLGAKLFEPIKIAFTGAMQVVEDLWNRGWQTVQTTFTNLSQQIGTGINTQLEAWKTNLSTSTSQYAPIASQALTAMQTTINAVMALIRGDWQGALTSIQNALTQWGGVATGIMQGIMGQLQGAVSAGVSAIQGMFSSLVSSAQSALATVQSLFAQAQSIVNNIARGIVATTQPATDQFQNLFNQAAAGVVSAGQQLYNWLVGHSIWPDMFNTMESITSTTMASIESTVTSGFASTVASAQASMAQLEALRQRAVAFMGSYTGGGNVSQAFAAAQAQAAQATTQVAKAVEAAAPAGGVFGGGWEPATPLNLTGGDLAAYAQKLGEAIFTATIGRSSAGGPATAEEVRQAQLNATLPISVVVDGVTVSRVVEQRMISQRQLVGGY